MWPAISGLATWGYAKSDPARAFAHLTKNTLTAHALTFPALWYGIWSGPDGLDPSTGVRPGEAWYSAATPMTDFPVLNNNQHAMPLLALLRTAGIEASATGLIIDPHVPGNTFSLSTSLLDLSRRPGVIHGVYRPVGNVTRTVEVHAQSISSATLNGAPITVAAGSPSVVITVPPLNGQPADFVVNCSP